jgi:Flp pilus assembly protein TadD
MQKNDNANAASLLRQATELKPDFAEAWVGLGMAEVQLSQIEKARSAYVQALTLHSERYKRTQAPNELQQQAFVLLLLGRADDAEALLAQGKQKHANSPTFQEFADNFPPIAGSELQKWQIPKE